jgi:predicted flavoprotein YhiN
MKGSAVAKKARSSDSLNKAQLIRDAFKKHGIDAAAKDVQAYTESHGATVAAAQISNIRTKLKGGNGVKTAKGKGGAVTADELIQARSMADKVGGVGRAKELLDILARLS